MTSSTNIPSKPSDPPPIAEKSLIHPISALLLMVIDALWTLADWAAAAWLVTIPLSFFAVAVPTYLVQKHVQQDRTGRSLAVASFLGVLAAIPTPITGTTVGAIVLALAGVRSLRSKL